MNQLEREAQLYVRTDPTRKSLDKFTIPELVGITLGYKIRIGNLATKRKKDLIKIIESNSRYKTDLRNKERRLEKIKEQKSRYSFPISEEQKELEKELQEQDTISDIIMQTANFTTSTDADWYANELRSELRNNQIAISDVVIGDFLFFNYSARFPQRYKFWDKRPLSFILNILEDGKLLGCNVHYLNPEIREGFAESMLNKTAIDVPKVFSKTLHSYFKTNMSTIFRIPRRPGEYGGIAKLVTEDFVRGDTGFSADLQTVWDSTNNR